MATEEQSRLQTPPRSPAKESQKPPNVVPEDEWRVEGPEEITPDKELSSPITLLQQSNSRAQNRQGGELMSEAKIKLPEQPVTPSVPNQGRSGISIKKVVPVSGSRPSQF